VIGVPAADPGAQSQRPSAGHRAESELVSCPWPTHRPPERQQRRPLQTAARLAARRAPLAPETTVARPSASPTRLARAGAPRRDELKRATSGRTTATQGGGWSRRPRKSSLPVTTTHASRLCTSALAARGCCESSRQWRPPGDHPTANSVTLTSGSPPPTCAASTTPKSSTPFRSGRHR
jgi:hypothetical protein